MCIRDSYNYVVQAGENNIDDVGNGLAAAVVASNRVRTATYSETANTLTLEGYVGLSFAVVATHLLIQDVILAYLLQILLFLHM